MRFVSRVLFTSVFLNIIPLYIIFAQTSSITDLERQLEQERSVYAARIERLEKLQARIAAAENARLQAVVVVDPSAKDFAKLPSVVRLRVADRFGTNFGTGSVIRSRDGRVLIVTVSHIFRNADEKSRISAEVFNPETGKIETFVVGHDGIKKTDPAADVGLLEIPTNRAIPVLPLASPEDMLKVGQKVISYGCGGGEPPTSLWHRITAFNRYIGPDTIECTGVPQQGRSGGALVDGQGRMIGITIAADQRDQRGLYTGLDPIRRILESAGIDPKDLEESSTVK